MQLFFRFSALSHCVQHVVTSSGEAADGSQLNERLNRPMGETAATTKDVRTRCPPSHEFCVTQ